MINLTARGFAPPVVLREFFGLMGPRTVQDVIHVLTDAGQNIIDLVDGIRFIPGTLVRQRLRKIFGLIFRRIVLKDCREFVRKVFPVQTVFELFTTKSSSSALSPRARIKLNFKRRQRKTSHSKATTSATNISSITSTGFTAAQTRPKSSS